VIHPRSFQRVPDCLQKTCGGPAAQHPAPGKVVIAEFTPTALLADAYNFAVMHRYTVVLEPETDGTFHAFVSALKGCHTTGSTEAEALSNAEEAISVYLESLTARGEPIPAEDLIFRPVEVA
jgi:predicted RNase H-like HicB family nuclease